MLAFDLKQIAWSGVMQDFKMSFKADPAADQSGIAQDFGGAVLDATLYQDWDDQTVMGLGAAFKATDALTLRAGYNYASNPIPDKYINALFPAIVESHITGGAGYAFNEHSDLNFAFSYALENEATNSVSSVTSTHSQISWQAMYTMRY
jgi:long-chain fatty acid transport protein